MNNARTCATDTHTVSLLSKFVMTIHKISSITLSIFSIVHFKQFPCSPLVPNDMSVSLWYFGVFAELGLECGFWHFLRFLLCKHLNVARMRIEGIDSSVSTIRSPLSRPRSLYSDMSDHHSVFLESFLMRILFQITNQIHQKDCHLFRPSTLRTSSSFTLCLPSNTTFLVQSKTHR